MIYSSPEMQLIKTQNANFLSFVSSELNFDPYLSRLHTFYGTKGWVLAMELLHNKMEVIDN